MRIRWPNAPIPEVEEAPYVNWLYRWPFISPLLSVSKNFLSLEQRVEAESAIDTAADLLVSSESIEVPLCIATHAMHLTYLICLLAAGQSLECSLYGRKLKNKMSVGPYHYHERQALMGWDSAFLTIFQNLAELRETLCPAVPGEASEEVMSGSRVRWSCECGRDCHRWHLVSEILEHLFYCRISLYELEYVARACGFACEELEEDLVRAGLLASFIHPAVMLDDMSELQVIEQAVKRADLGAVTRSLCGVLGEEGEGPLEAFAGELLLIGRVPKHITRWFAFGTCDMIDTCVNDIPVKNYVNNVDRWENMKRDLKNVTEAMVGALPPEDVVHRFTSFLESKTSRKPKTSSPRATS